MRLPLNWLKDFVDYGKRSPQELAEIFTLLGHEVERVEDPTKNLEKIYVGEVLRIIKHPNADKLRLAETRVGSKVFKIVCGGSNLQEEMTVAVALPGARVRWHGQGDLVELKETEIRGVKSVGMICASAEIGLESLFPAKEKEIIDLSNLSKRNFDQKGSFVSGEPLANALGLEPVLHLDITPNRADCLSVIGLARELAAGIGKKFVEAKFRQKEVSLRQPWSSGFNLHISNKNLCPKYTAQVVTNIKVGESLLCIKTRLWQAGVRPINNIVDATNYVLLETGEPMHAFDLDKLSQKQFSISNSQFSILIRNAKSGEKIKALDGNSYELDETMLVIADAKRLVAIAGVMGGEETGVTAETKNILLEAAIFDPALVRKTSRKLGLRSESSVRFERGIPWLYPELAQNRIRKIISFDRSETSNKVLIEAKHRTKNKAENEHPLAAASLPSPKPIFISQTLEAINQMLNLELTSVQIKKSLTSLGFGWHEAKFRRTLQRSEGRKFSLDNPFRVQVPWWRLDIKIPEDLYEEVGRIYGLNKLTPTLPQGELKLAPKNYGRELAEAARDILFALGFDEVLTYSFYGREVLEKDGSSPTREPHMQVENPINPNQELLRTNLTRNLLDSASRNARLFDQVKIFEIGRVFHPMPRSEKSELHSNDPNLSLLREEAKLRYTPQVDLASAEEKKPGFDAVLPNEETHFAFVYTAKGATEEEIFRKLKGDVEVLISKQKHAEFKKMDGGLDIYFNNTLVGWLGILDEARRLNWKIKEPCALAEFNLDAVLASPTHLLKYQSILEFPPVRRDIAFVVDEKINYGEIIKALQETDELVRSIELFDIFRSATIGKDKKSLAIHIALQSLEKTLSDEDANIVMNKLTSLLKEKFSANVRE